MTTSRSRAAGRLSALGLAAALLLALLPVSGASAATRYTLDVSKQADFVAQTNFVQCVGARLQMINNMIEPGRDRSSKTQLRLQNLARTWSGSRPDGRQRQGASVRGWAAGLNIMGAGPYKLVGASSIEEALAMAATAIADTGKPVGLLMWRGRHAWVMSGFTATGDPNKTASFRVTRAIVHDPLYPYGSAVWGPSPRPGEALTVAELGRQYLPRRNRLSIGGQPSALGGKYVLVLPYEPDYSVLATSIR